MDKLQAIRLLQSFDDISPRAWRVQFASKYIIVHLCAVLLKEDYGEAAQRKLFTAPAHHVLAVSHPHIDMSWWEPDACPGGWEFCITLDAHPQLDHGDYSYSIVRAIIKLKYSEGVQSETENST